jgi:hypothetical protein
MQVDHVMVQGGDLSNILYVPGGGTPDLGCGFPRFENLRVDGGGGYDDDPGQVTPNSILEHPAHQQGSGCGYGSSSNGSGDVVPPRKKKSGGGGFFPQIVLSLGNRRKGAPHRAPLA